MSIGKESDQETRSKSVFLSNYSYSGMFLYVSLKRSFAQKQITKMLFLCCVYLMRTVESTSTAYDEFR